MRILVVEDNEKIAKYIKQALSEESYSVDCVFDGATGERRAMTGNHDLIVLDLMLPQKSGLDVCIDLRKNNINIPIIMLTAKGETEDRVLGLDSGADDYLVKPFEIKELVARIRALLRRPDSKISEILKIQDLALDTQKHTLLKGKQEILLTLKEYAVLEYLMRNAEMVVTREKLLEHCWDFAYSAFSNITDVYIKQIRKKLKDTNEKYIETIRGVGYKFKE
jgi:two-component system copper resistance phosphate regulon response regulator CusR